MNGDMPVETDIDTDDIAKRKLSIFASQIADIYYENRQEFAGFKDKVKHMCEALNLPYDVDEIFKAAEHQYRTEGLTALLEELVSLMI